MKDLREGLVKLSDLLLQWEAKTAKQDDIERLLDLLAPHDELTVKAYCSLVEKALSDDGAPKPSRGGGGKKKAAGPRDDVVQTYLQALREAGPSYEKLSTVLGKLSKDKKARNVELEQIASEYCGTPISVSKKDDGIDAIKYRHRSMSSIDRRNEDIPGIF